MKRVLVVTGSLYNPIGGPYHSVKATALGFQKKGFEVKVLGTRDHKTQMRNVKTYLGALDNTEVIALRKLGPYNFHFSLDWRTYFYSVKESDFISVQGVWMLNCIIVGLIARLLRKPYYVAVRGEFNSPENLKAWDKRFIKPLVKVFFKGANYLQVLNDREIKALRRFGYQGRILKIPNGIELQFVAPISKRKKQILYLGRLHKTKGLDELVQAWNSLNDLKSWELIIAGDGQSGYKQEFLKSISNNPSINYVGSVQGELKGELFSQASWFILPSYREGMPMAVLEALSYGTPVLITEACNLEVVYRYGAGIKIRSELEDIRKVLRLVSNIPANLQEEYMLNAQRLAKERFNWSRVIDELVLALNFDLESDQ